MRDDALPESGPMDLESVIAAALEASDPEAELERLTRGQTQLRDQAARILARVRQGEQSVPAHPLRATGSSFEWSAHQRADGDLHGGDAVQPTATDDLLHRLGNAPRLDRTRYRAEGEIGRGGMGVVLRIHDNCLNRHLAMKVMLDNQSLHDPEAHKLGRQVLGRFLEEAQITSQLDHPGIVPVHELGLDSRGEVYFTMRLVKGQTANTIFELARREQDGWTRTRAIDVVLKVCDAMAYAHSKGVLHRDLKPRNIMVGQFGEVYVMDWGLAKVLRHVNGIESPERERTSAVSQVLGVRQHDVGGDAGSPVATMHGQHLGTPSYMSPEQARSEPLDARTDVYAIGAMLYELLAGCAPYTSPGQQLPAEQILRQVAECAPRSIDAMADAPVELVAIAEKAMARGCGSRPEQRERFGCSGLRSRQVTHTRYCE